MGRIAKLNEDMFSYDSSDADVRRIAREIEDACSRKGDCDITIAGTDVGGIKQRGDDYILYYDGPQNYSQDYDDLDDLVIDLLQSLDYEEYDASEEDVRIS